MFFKNRVIKIFSIIFVSSSPFIIAIIEYNFEVKEIILKLLFISFNIFSFHVLSVLNWVFMVHHFHMVSKFIMALKHYKKLQIPQIYRFIKENCEKFCIFCQIYLVQTIEKINVRNHVTMCQTSSRGHSYFSNLVMMCQLSITHQRQFL